MDDLNETIDQLKIKGFKVFKTKYPGGVITYREPTLDETLYLDRLSDNSNLKLMPILRSIILDITGDLGIDTIDGQPTIVKEIIKTVRDNSRFSNEDKVKEEYARVNHEMDTNYLETLVFWVSRQLAYPEFIYISKTLSPGDFMRYVVLAENMSGLHGFFLYGITNEESHLSDNAKRILFPERYQQDNRPDWQKAGLPHEPMNIQEMKVLKQYMRSQQTGQPPPVESTEPMMPPKSSGKGGIDAATQMAIQMASKRLALQVQADEMAHAAGKERPKHFDWTTDEELEREAEL